MEYAPFPIEYLLNGEDIDYLSNLRFPDGSALYNTRELRHMRDVKSVTQIAFAIALAGSLVALFSIYTLWKNPNTHRHLRRGLLDGSLLTLGIIITIVVGALLSWNTLFSGFHEIFFENGTWLFAYSDTLIRLFPEQFWFDAALFIGTLTSGGAGIIWLITWRAGKASSSNS